MPFDTYANFRTTVKNFLDVQDLTTTAIDDLVTIAEHRIYDEYWGKSREKALSVTVGGTNTVTIPSDYDVMRYAYLDGAPNMPLQKKSAEWISQNYPSNCSGRPVFYAEQDNEFIFGPQPDSAYVMTGIYYMHPGHMATTGTINAVFTANTELFLFATLSEAEPYLGREQRQIWEGKYQQALLRSNRKDTKRLFSGSPLAVTVE